MPKYVKCPRCDLNYMLEGEEYCDVCKAELKKAPPLVFAVDDEDEEAEMILCPRCHRNFVRKACFSGYRGYSLLKEMYYA